MAKLHIVQAQTERWQDVTLRARATLSVAVLVVVRASSQASDWLLAGGIETPRLSYEPRRHLHCLERILAALEVGDVAWLSPGLAAWTAEDAALLDALLARGIEVVSVPGGSDLVDVLVLSGLPADRFVFLGTLPAPVVKRRAMLEEAAREPHTLICAVRGVPLEEALQDVRAVLGERRVAAGQGQRMWRGRADERPDWDARGLDPFSPSGSYLVIEGASQEPVWDEGRVRDQVGAMLAEGGSLRDVSRAVAGFSGWRRKAVYEIGLRVEGERAAGRDPDGTRE